MEIFILPCVYIIYILLLFLKYKFPQWGMSIRYERRDFSYTLDLSNLIEYKRNKYTDDEIKRFKEKCKVKLVIHLSILLFIILIILFKSIQ
jgi:hypothetical protein